MPVNPKATQEELKKLVGFFQENDELAKEIAERGYQHVWENLTDKNVKCYWRRLLKKYSKFLKYNVVRDNSLTQIE